MTPVKRLQSSYWTVRERTMALLDAARSRLRPWGVARQQRGNRGLFALRIDAKVGFFAQLSWCLIVLAHCRQRGLRPYILLTGPLYAARPGDNWLHYFFEPLGLLDDDAQRLARGHATISTVTDISQAGVRRAPAFTLEQAHELFTRSFALKPDVSRHVDEFVARHFGTGKVLGVHYRGTDKAGEAEPVSWPRVRDTVRNYLGRHPEVATVFVASDEQAFVDWIARELDEVRVVAHDDDSRSTGTDAVHIDPTRGDNWRKGWDALVNCLLLSRCDALIRTASFLSAWCLVFNPGLPVVVLNKPFADKLWFPDDAVAARSMDQYLPATTAGEPPPGNAALSGHPPRT